MNCISRIFSDVIDLTDVFSSCWEQIISSLWKICIFIQTKDLWCCKSDFSWYLSSAANCICDDLYRRLSTQLQRVPKHSGLYWEIEKLHHILFSLKFSRNTEHKLDFESPLLFDLYALLFFYRIPALLRASQHLTFSTFNIFNI